MSIILLDTGMSLLNGVGTGFAPIPKRFLPMRLELMGYATPGQLSEKVWGSNWRVQMGDWEVF